jgi:hypothetical protein
MLISTSTASLEAIRQKRYRRRQREGVTIVPVAVSDADVDALIEGGWLGEDDSSDRQAVARAIRRAAGLSARPR